MVNEQIADLKRSDQITVSKEIYAYFCSYWKLTHISVPIAIFQNGAHFFAVGAYFLITIWKSIFCHLKIENGR